jgi:hypothetical protein
MQTDDQNIVKPIKVSEHGRIGSTSFERDPAKRTQIWELPLDKQEEERRFYISEGPYQPYMKEYPYNKNRRRFQFSYSQIFLGWSIHLPHIMHIVFPVLSLQRNQVEGVAQIHSLLRGL